MTRQHGAMEYSTAPVDIDAVRRFRLNRLHQKMREADVAGLLLFDPINTRYATDATNMQIWSTHYETRCVFIALEGPVVLFDYDNHPHLVEGLTAIDEYRVMPVFYFFAVGPRGADGAKRFGNEIAALMKRYGGGNWRLALDRLSLLGTDALRSHGIELVDAGPLTETARTIKSPEEVALMRVAIDVAEEGSRAMQAALTPGITENALWAKLHETNIRLGGEWIETRLLTSGPRTSWKIPERFQSRRYSCLLHGVGLADEYPSIPYLQDLDKYGYEGVVTPGMTLCVESFIGTEGGREGVKLEEQVLITATGIELLSTYPFEEDLLR